jgi:hypothetical protein
MKWRSTGYVYAFPIFFRADLLPGRVGVGVITARAGDGDLSQEWVFGSTSGDPLEAYYNPQPGVKHGPYGHPINELAAKAQPLVISAHSRPSVGSHVCVTTS